MRDVAQIVGLMTTILIFFFFIFYPITAFQEEYRGFMQISPITFVVEQARDTMIWGKGINWVVWWAHTSLSTIVAWLGFAWFQKTRKGFADVL